ncbi:cytochrome P450 [Mycena capillaripes]|nr:cytochrome P450 [Mycena capillaripes]
MDSSIVLALVPLALCAAWLLKKIGSREDGLPPGPPTIPILGNLHIFPTEFAHYKFTEWAREYGGIYSLKVGPSTAIVLTDAVAVKELLDRRSATTADRPSLHIPYVVTGGLHMVFAQGTSSTWKTQRRAAAAILTSQATARHLPIQRAEATQLLYNILHSPESFFTDIRRYSISVILSVLHGRRVPRYDAPEITHFFDVMRQWNLLIEAGAAPPVDILPLLKFVPERWAKWKRDCNRISGLQRAQYFGLLEQTRERVRLGDENGSYMEEVLMRKDELGMDDETTAYFGGALLETGSDTTSTFLQSLVLALVAYPDAQKKAHEEIDRVVGEHRMPTLDDLERMPYIRAIILETHRFRPVAPLAVPHTTTTAEEYQGYIIPKGATIFANLWGIFHDPGKSTFKLRFLPYQSFLPALYDDPEIFVPDRYLLTENGTKLGVDGSALRHTLAFGFGRRLCPGLHLAQNSINLNTMNLLWAFDFKSALDANGDPVAPDIWAYGKGATTIPKPFKCRITPRTSEKARIIESEFLEAADTFSKFEMGLSAEDRAFVAKSRIYSD